MRLVYIALSFLGLVAANTENRIWRQYQQQKRLAAKVNAELRQMEEQMELERIRKEEQRQEEARQREIANYERARRMEEQKRQMEAVKRQRQRQMERARLQRERQAENRRRENQQRRMMEEYRRQVKEQERKERQERARQLAYQRRLQAQEQRNNPGNGCDQRADVYNNFQGQRNSGCGDNTSNQNVRMNFQLSRTETVHYDDDNVENPAEELLNFLPEEPAYDDGDDEVCVDEQDYGQTNYGDVEDFDLPMNPPSEEPVLEQETTTTAKITTEATTTLPTLRNPCDIDICNSVQTGQICVAGEADEAAFAAGELSVECRCAEVMRWNTETGRCEDPMNLIPVDEGDDVAMNDTSEESDFGYEY